jgi:hypothetical protein
VPHELLLRRELTFVGVEQATWLVPRWGASQLRDSAGFRPDFAVSTPAGKYVPDSASIGPRKDGRPPQAKFGRSEDGARA